MLFDSIRLTWRLTWVSVNHIYPQHRFGWLVLYLFEPWLEIHVRIMHFIQDINEVFTGIFPFALNQLQDFAHLKK